MKKESAEFLTTKQLALLWQVSEATIKRWADAGRLRPSKTLGGHRRFALTDVIRFQREHGLGQSAEAGIATLQQARELPHRDDQLEQLFQAIVTGWTDTATSILLKLYLDKVPLVRLLDEMVTGVMHRVGESWHGGEMSVADEHLATRTMIRTLESISGLLEHGQTKNLNALCCAVEEELHEIPAHCAQILLESEGWTVRNFGANTPYFALAIAVERYQPDLVCVSSTMNLALDRCARDYPEFLAAVEKSGTRVVLGGAGFLDQSVRQRFPANLYAENFAQLLEFINS